MNTSFRVPLWRIFMNWFIAVIVGSILWPAACLLFKDAPYHHPNDVPGIMVISAVLSALISIPAIGLLLLTTHLLNTSNVEKPRYQMIHMAVHLFLALLTFAVMFPFGNIPPGEVIFYLILAFSYTLAGCVSWLITFVIYDRKRKGIPPATEGLIDGTTL